MSSPCFLCCLVFPVFSLWLLLFYTILNFAPTGSGFHLFRHPLLYLRFNGFFFGSGLRVNEKGIRFWDWVCFFFFFGTLLSTCNFAALWYLLFLYSVVFCVHGSILQRSYADYAKPFYGFHQYNSFFILQVFVYLCFNEFCSFDRCSMPTPVEGSIQPTTEEQ